MIIIPINKFNSSLKLGGALSVTPNEPRPINLLPVPKPHKIIWPYVAEAVGLFTLGMLTHQLPSRAASGRWLIPTDWKVLFRIGAGLLAVNRFNKALGWQPKPVENALETVAIINPLALGVSKTSLAQFSVIAPLVAGMVALMSFINNRYAEKVQDNLGIHPLITRLAMSVGFGVLGYKLFPKIFNRIFKNTAVLGAGLTSGAAFMTTCARGCSPSIICMSEVAELFGGLWNWLRGHHGTAKQGQPQLNTKELIHDNPTLTASSPTTSLSSNPSAARLLSRVA